MVSVVGRRARTGGSARSEGLAGLVRPLSRRATGPSVTRSKRDGGRRSAQRQNPASVVSLQPISRRDKALEDMQRAAEAAAGALREVCTVLDEVALDMRFARHASREPLRLSSERIENIARTLVGEAQSCGPVGAKHTSIVGKAALAAATISLLPFAEDAGQSVMIRYKASHERATRYLERVHRNADIAQSEKREDLSRQITALFGELDSLYAEVGMEMAGPRRRARTSDATATVSGWLGPGRSPSGHRTGPHGRRARFDRRRPGLRARFDEQSSRATGGDRVPDRGDLRATDRGRRLLRTRRCAESDLP